MIAICLQYAEGDDEHDLAEQRSLGNKDKLSHAFGEVKREIQFCRHSSPCKLNFPFVIRFVEYFDAPSPTTIVFPEITIPCPGEAPGDGFYA